MNQILRDTANVALVQICRFTNCLQTPVLVAVDDYNVLYSHTNYHEWMNEVYRRQLQPHELRLASAFKLLERQVCLPALLLFQQIILVGNVPSNHSSY